MEELLGRLLGLDQLRLSDGEVHLDWLNPLPPWLIFLLALGILAGSVFLYRRERQDVGAGPKSVLAVLRALIVMLIVVMLLGPMLTVEIAREKKSIVLFLIDVSDSMAKRDPRPQRLEKLEEIAAVCGVPVDDAAKMTRLELVRAVLGNEKLGIVEQIGQRMRVAFYTFARRPHTLKPEDLGALAAGGNETAIGDALQLAVAQHRGEQIAAIVVFTDGRNNTGRDPVEVAKMLSKQLVPIFTLAPGDPQPPRDVALGPGPVADTIPVNDTLHVGYTLSNQGFAEQEAEIDFYVHRLDDETSGLPTDPEAIERMIDDARSRLIRTDRPTMGSQPLRDRSFEWTPSEKGLFAVILRARPREDELTRKNNYVLTRVRVTDDVVKVLYVDHLPRWEYRYLKNALVRDDTVLVHCLLTSADVEFPQDKSLPEGRPRQQLEEYKEFFVPLQEFPKDLKSLLKYEVLIIGDVPLEKLGGEAIQKNIATFVEEFGGGIIFIAGTRYNPESFVGTPLERLLPVSPQPRQSDGAIYDKELSYVLSDEAKSHPTTRLMGGRGDTEKVWQEQLPRLFWHKRVKEPKSTAHTLVHLQAVKNGGSRYPLFVYAQYGRGRIFLSLTDETWRWRFNTGDGPYFFPFWKQVLRWLREPRLHSARRYRVIVDRERYVIGEKVPIEAEAFDANYERLTDPKLEMELVPPDGKPLRFQMDGDGKGTYKFQFTPQDIGHYEVRVGDPREPGEMGAQSFEVIIPNREDENPIIDEAALQEIAAASGGGSYLRLAQTGELPKMIKTRILRFAEPKQDDIWDSPLFYLIFALLITTEWILRKVFRML
jgi:hypothetical protein